MNRRRSLGSHWSGFQGARPWAVAATGWRAVLATATATFFLVAIACGGAVEPGWGKCGQHRTIQTCAKDGDCIWLYPPDGVTCREQGAGKDLPTEGCFPKVKCTSDAECGAGRCRQLTTQCNRSPEYPNRCALGYVCYMVPVCQME